MGKTVVEQSTGAADDRTAGKRFVGVWAVALALSLMVLYFELDTLAKSLHDFGWSTLKSDTVAKWLGLPDTATVPAKHGGEPHGSPHVVAATVQIAAAVAISWMWFGAFRILGRAQPGGRRKWWAVGMASVVVLLFAFTMHQAYQPAVLVMALIAIIVAAEHYSGLKEQQDDLKEQRDKLDAQSSKLSTAATGLATVEDYIGRLASELSTAAASLVTVKDYTGRLAEDAGLSHFVHHVYERYAAAETIHAVVRMHDIDPVWWSFAKKDADPWEKYLEDAEVPLEHATSERRNLARALARPSNRKLAACFVADLPMPGSDEWDRRLKPDDGEPLFGDLLGFAWQWIVLQEVQKTWKQVNCRAWVSRPLCWVHATDRVVFQVLRREPRSRSAVLVIADRDSLSSSAGAKETYRGMVQWATEEVRRYADRGCTAEDYLLAVLRHAAALASKQGDADLVASSDATADLGYLLELLGARTWIDSPARKSESTLRVLDDELVFQLSARVFVKALVAMFPGRSRISIRELWGRLA